MTFFVPFPDDPPSTYIHHPFGMSCAAALGDRGWETGRQSEPAFMDGMGE